MDTGLCHSVSKKAHYLHGCLQPGNAAEILANMSKSETFAQHHRIFAAVTL